MDILILIFSFILFLNDKRAYAYIGLFLLSTQFFGYVPNSSDYLFKHNITDTSLVLIVFIVATDLLVKKNNLIYKDAYGKEIRNKLLYFISILIILSLISIIINGDKIFDNIRYLKNWLPLLLFFSLRYEKYVVLVDTIKLLFYITFFQLLIYHIEFIFKTPLLSISVTREEIMAGQVLERGNFLPQFTSLFFLFIIFRSSLFYINKKIKISFIILTLSGIIISATRSMLFAIIFSLGAGYFYSNKNKIKSIISIIPFLTIIIILVTLYSPFYARIEQGFIDVQNTFSNYDQMIVTENFSFRIFHLIERFNFIAQQPKTFLFGLGFIMEDSFRTNIFKIGLINSIGGVTQLDSGDISWSVLFVRLGIIGVFIYMYFFISLIIISSKRNKNSIGKIIGIYLIVNLLILSFFSSNITTGFFFLSIIFLFYINNREHEFGR